MLDHCLGDAETPGGSSKFDRARYQDAVGNGSSALNPSTPNPFRTTRAKVIAHLVSAIRLIVDLSKATRSSSGPVFNSMMGMVRFIFNFMGFSNFMALVAMGLEVFSGMSQILQNKLVIGVHAKHIQLAILNGAKCMV